MPAIYWLNYPTSDKPRLKCQVQHRDGFWEGEIMDTASNDHHIELVAREESSETAKSIVEDHLRALSQSLGLRPPDRELDWTERCESS